MTTSNSDYRFGGMERLLGVESFKTLKSSHVMVLGLGGVGSWATEALARSGVGNLTLVDFDEVCLSNTNRQLHALQNTVGQMKADLMAERCKLINPEISVRPLPDFFDQDSLDEILGLKPDFIIDAIDSLSAKCLLISECRKRQLSLIVSGGAGGLIDPSKIEIKDLSQSHSDPLLHTVRKRLRQDYEFPRGKKKFNIPCVFSSELPSYPQPDGSISKDPEKKPKQRLDCHGGLGTASFVTGSFGFLMASHVITHLQSPK